MKIEVEFVESIPLTRSGKYMFTVSEVEIDV
jgi:acyl-coenzyme A synthetase/AMP-(fatty) acid ligase